MGNSFVHVATAAIIVTRFARTGTKCDVRDGMLTAVHGPAIDAATFGEL